MAILIDSYGKENQEDFLIVTNYIRFNKSMKMARNIFGVITNKYSIMDDAEIKLANSNQCEYLVGGVPIWVTAKPLNKASFKKRIKDIYMYMKGKKSCIFYYKDYNFKMDKTNG